MHEILNYTRSRRVTSEGRRTFSCLDRSITSRSRQPPKAKTPAAFRNGKWLDRVNPTQSWYRLQKVSFRVKLWCQKVIKLRINTNTIINRKFLKKTLKTKRTNEAYLPSLQRKTDDRVVAVSLSATTLHQSIRGLSTDSSRQSKKSSWIHNWSPLSGPHLQSARAMKNKSLSCSYRVTLLSKNYQILRRRIVSCPQNSTFRRIPTV